MANGKVIAGLTLLSLLLLGRRAMPKKPADIQLTPHFRLSEFLRSEAVPEVAYYKPTDEEIERLRKLCREVLEPLREYVGKPVVVTGGARPASVRNAAGQTFYEALSSKGYAPANNSDHEHFIGVDVRFRGSAEDFRRAFDWLKTQRKVRQVGIYFKTIGNAIVPDHLHVSVVAPGYPRKTDTLSYVRLDGRKVTEANV